jgi:hypothetical protein
MRPAVQPQPLIPEWVHEIQWPLVGAVAGGVALIAALLALWVWYRRRRAAAERLAMITGHSYAYLRDVVLPDPQGLPLHFDFLLLTARGAVVVDFRDVRGNVFGGDQMSEWTVMSRRGRGTFTNPQPGLLDRIAALRALVTELPIDGQVVFTARARFPKGLPSQTRLLESLVDEHQALNPSKAGPLAEAWMNDWRAIASASKPSQLASPTAAV